MPNVTKKDYHPDVHGHSIGATSDSRRWRKATSRLKTLGFVSAATFDLHELDGNPESYYGPLHPALVELGIERGVSAYVAPYLRRAAATLLALLASGEARGWFASSEVGAAIIQAFEKRLCAAASQVVATLINAARITNQVQGASSSERWAGFERLVLANAEYRQDCARRFAILEKILSTTTDYAIEAWGEFFTRLTEDYERLGSIVPGGEIGKIQKIAFYAGDPHNGGRSVVILEGRCGKVVYKPRPLDTDETLASMIAWLDQQLGLGMQHLSVINRDRYGWMAFAQEADCRSDREVREYFTRSGALMGLLYICGASDLHYENIVSVGSQPYVVDAESLFNAPISLNSRVLARRQRAGLDTVINLSYFPALFPVGQSYIDISGAGYIPNQKVLLARSIQKDPLGDLVSTGQTLVLAASRNLPKRDAEFEVASKYASDIENGFFLALTAIMNNKAEFIGRPDLLSSCADVRSRFIPRSTADYMRVINAALHPHACVDQGRHDDALKTLSRRDGWTERVLVDLLVEEIRSVRNNDVPFFKSVAGSRSIWTSDNREIKGAFQESGLEATIKRVKALDDNVIERHIRSIRLAFSASAGRVKPVDSQQEASVEVDHRPALIATAGLVAENVLASRIEVKGHIFWLGRSNSGEGFSTALLDEDLYGGVGGIGIFLAELAKATGASRYRRAALKCLNALDDPSAKVRSSMGAFDGLAGTLFCQMAICTALGLPLVESAGQALQHLKKMVRYDQTFDIISGAAGALLVGLRARNFPQLAEYGLELATECAEHLLSNRRLSDGVSTWKSPTFDVPLTGLAHGSCGIGLALGEYAVITKSETVMRAADSAFRYASLSRSDGAWRDLRSPEGHMCAWCHGSGGMVLARQRYRELVGAEAPGFIDEEIALGMSDLRKTTLWSDTLCHGKVGNWEPLWRGSVIDVEIAGQQASAMCARMLRGEHARGDLSEATPDLMNGLAGIGLQLLRSFDSGVTEVVTLRGPLSWKY